MIRLHVVVLHYTYIDRERIVKLKQSFTKSTHPDHYQKIIHF